MFLFRTARASIILQFTRALLTTCAAGPLGFADFGRALIWPLRRRRRRRVIGRARRIIRELALAATNMRAREAPRAERARQLIELLLLPDGLVLLLRLKLRLYVVVPA